MKYLPKGYSTVTEADPSKVQNNEKNITARVMKKVYNAPQAIIIEVT